MEDSPQPPVDDSLPPEDDVAPPAVAQVVQASERLRAELARVIVGQREVVDLLLISLLAGGHSLFEGVPGLAKTLLVQSLAEATDCSFSRIQFTPDLLPADITGTEILEDDLSTGRKTTRFVQGPLFAHVVLADEINRTPPKTQAALLQAMQEGAVTAGSQTLPLPQPFFVFATQNPIEQEGTYPLPEAQLDRFMFLVRVGYPSADEELEIVDKTTGAQEVSLDPCISPDELADLQRLTRSVPAGPAAVALAVALVRASRPGESGLEFVDEWVSWGAGPRASQFLILGAKARALVAGRPAVSREDILALSGPVLRHRIVLNFRAEAEGVTADSIIERLVEQVDVQEAH